MKVIVVQELSGSLGRAMNNELLPYSNEEIKEIKVIPSHEKGYYLAMIVLN